MNLNRKLKALKLVRVGEVLCDQQKRMLLLCRSCHRHYLSLETFQKHLIKCIALKHIVSSIEKLHYDENQKEMKIVNGKQELHIYEPYAVRTESNNFKFDWEADLKNFRWRMEDSPVKTIEPKQPNDIDTSYPTTGVDDKPSIEQSSKSAVNGTFHADDSQTTPTTQTTLIDKRDKLGENLNIFGVPDKSKNNKYVMKNIAEEFWRLDAGNPSNSTAASNPSSDHAAEISIPPTDVFKKDTQEILKKLRACGVSVKRRNTRGPRDDPALVDAKKKLASQMKKK